MSNEKILPQMEVEQAADGARRARYAAYIQRIRRLGMRKAEYGKAEETECSVNGGTIL